MKNDTSFAATPLWSFFLSLCSVCVPFVPAQAQATELSQPIQQILMSDSTKFGYSGDELFLSDFGNPKADSSTVPQTLPNYPVVPDKASSSNSPSKKTAPTTTTKKQTETKPVVYTRPLQSGNFYTVSEPSNNIPQNKLIQAPVVSYPKGKLSNGDDAIFKARLSALPALIPMDYNKWVGDFIQVYLNKQKTQLNLMLPRTDLYFPFFESVLNKHGLPDELKYLPVILSALNPHTQSEDGAAGLWQLSYKTAKLHGLDANNYIDERRDPLLSTEVAAKHLRNLYKKYMDWHLVIAAYTGGEASVDKAIKRAGGVRNYWDLSTFLPIETQAYVPFFIAAAYVMNYHQEHGIYKRALPMSYNITDTLYIKPQTSLKAIAIQINMPLEDLQLLNPAIIRDIIPASAKGYPLNLPLSKISALDAYRNNLDDRREIYIDRTKEDQVRIPKSNPWNKELGSSEAENGSDAAEDIGKMLAKHTIQEGETLLSIAQKYDCTIDKIKQWNGAKAEKLIAGQSLSVYKKITDDASLMNNELPETAPITNPKTSTTNKPAKTIDSKYRKHIIKDGETIWGIAQKYKIDLERIKRLNGKNADTLKPGQELLIPKP